MTVPPQKRHRPTQGRKRRKSSPLKTSASVNESHSSDESLIEYVERTHPPEIETLSPRNPPKAVIRELKMSFGGRGISRLAPNPYMRLRGGTGGPGPAAPPGTPAAPAANRGLSRALNPGFENSWKDYTRSRAVLFGANKPPTAPPRPAQRLPAHMKEVIEIEDDIRDIYDTSSEDDNGPPRGLGGGPGGGPGTLPRTFRRRSGSPFPKLASRKGSKERDPMDPEQGPDPMDTTEDGDGRTARVDRQTPLLQEEAKETPESSLSPAGSGISTPSWSSSSSALSRGAAAPGNKRKAKKGQAKTIILTATSNRPVRQRKPPNRLGFSRTTQHRGEPGPKLITTMKKNTKIPRPVSAQQGRSVPDGDTRELETDDVDDVVVVKSGSVLVLASHESSEAIAYRNACEEICDDPREREKYFPAIGKVRRIRSWSGSKLPPDVERKVQRLLPRSSTVFRPFGPRKVQEDRVSSPLESTESTTKGCQI